MKNWKAGERQSRHQSQAPFPASAPSNLAPHAFTIDGVACSSMEGFLQSLKVEDRAEQEHICALAGGEARGRGQRHAWNTTGTLWWRGEPVDRLSAAYQALLDRAYEALFAQSRKFRDALAASGEAKLTHSIGKDDRCETILTTDELCGRLERLRARLVADAAKSPAGG